MSILVRLAFKNLKVKKEYMHRLIDEMDTDSDGYISLRETAESVRVWGRKLKKAMKYLGTKA